MILNRRTLISGAAAGVALSLTPKVFAKTQTVAPKIFEYADIKDVATIIEFNSKKLKTRTLEWKAPDGRKGVDIKDFFPLHVHNVLIPILPIANSIDCHLDKHNKDMDKMMLDLLFEGMRIKISEDMYNVLLASGNDQKETIDITDLNEIKESHVYFGKNNNHTIIGINPNKDNTFCCFEDNTDFVAHKDEHLFRRKRVGYYTYKCTGQMNCNSVTVYNYQPGFVIPKTKFDILCDKIESLA